MKLRIVYELNKVLKVTETDELFRVRDGFRIDASGNYCQSIEAETFILPHMIKEIRKENENGSSDIQN
jgi:hypothetical protein